MEAEDLRRGNLILTSKDRGGKPFLRSIVQEIKAASVVVDGDRAVLLSDCAGIVLDEEWLRMFNKKSIDGLLIDSVKEGYYLSLSGEYGQEAWCQNKTFLCVHQLQNLYYALTGEELKILTPV